MQFSTRHIRGGEYIEIRVIACNGSLQTGLMTKQEAQLLIPELEALIEEINEMEDIRKER